MGTEKFNIAADVLPVVAPKPARPEPATSTTGSQGNGFRELLSDSLGKGRETQQSERRERNEAPTTNGDSKAAAVAPEQRPQSNDRPKPETAPAERPAEANDEPAAPPSSEKDTPTVDSAAAVDLDDHLEHADEQAVVHSQAIEGTPPAEFIATLLATETAARPETLTNIPAEGTETTTITVQSPPHGLVTAMAAAGGARPNAPNVKQPADATVKIEVGPPQLTAADPAVMDTTQPPTTGQLQVGIDPAANGDAAADPTSQRPAGDVPQEPKTAAMTGQPLAEQHADAEIFSVNKTEPESTPATAANAAPQAPAPTAETASTSRNNDVESTQSSQPVETTVNEQNAEQDSADQQSGEKRSQTPQFARTSVEAESAPTPTVATTAEESPSGETNPRSETSDANSAVSAPAAENARPAVAATPTPPQANPVNVHRPDFFAQVAQSARTSLESGQQITMRLTPPELGTLQIEVAVKDGHVSARIDAQTTAAQKLLADNLPQLKEALSQHGAQVDRLEVFVADNSAEDRGQSMSQGFAGRGGRQDLQERETGGTNYRTDAAETDDATESDKANKPVAVRSRGKMELDITI